MQAIDEVKTWLSRMTPGELITIVALMFLVVGFVAGHYEGQYTTSEKIREQLENYATQPYYRSPTSHFTVDGTHIYYLVKTNVTIDEYKAALLEMNIEP